MDKEKKQFKENLQKASQEYGDRQTVSYDKLFNPIFMQKNTNFTSIEVFLRELDLDKFSDIERLPAKQVDSFVNKETQFATWAEMQQEAIRNYITSLF